MLLFFKCFHKIAVGIKPPAFKCLKMLSEKTFNEKTDRSRDDRNSEDSCIL